MSKINLTRNEVATIWNSLQLSEMKSKGKLMKVDIKKFSDANFKEDKFRTKHLKQRVKISRKLINELERILF